MRIKLLIIVGIISMACLSLTAQGRTQQQSPERWPQEGDKQMPPKLTPPTPYGSNQKHIQQLPEPPEPRVEEGGKRKPSKLTGPEQPPEPPESKK